MHLPKAGKQEYAALFKKYRALEIAEVLTDQLAVEWWSASFDILVKYKVNMAEVERDFMHRASIRPGAAQLFGLCRANDIPTVILSGGVREVIEAWSRHYAIRPSLMLSTALVLDHAGTIVGWDKATLIHVLNKHEADHAELTSIRKNRPKAIVIGDGMSDADMAKGDADVLRIRVFDPRDDETADIGQVRARTFERFDAIIESGSLAPVLTVIESMIA
jgi:HAD superfamily phosphoserine phosphatase-like hydrolase